MRISIAERAWNRIANLASLMVYGDSRVKELALAELEFQRWLGETCDGFHDGG